ncbi:MAG: hypothetical protein E7262_01855 [Lachnospiraceae bacterium]|nr:hypothetical protein [Lachnospiraceae bacterium]
MKRKIVCWTLIIAFIVTCSHIDTYASSESFTGDDSLSGSKDFELKGNFVKAPDKTATPAPTKIPTPAPDVLPSKVPDILPSKKPSVVYSVDITWESMQFSYTMGDEKWNADKHVLEVPSGGKKGKWSAGKNNGITVQNNSTVKLNAKLGFEAANSSRVTGTYNRAANGTGTKITTISVGPKGGANTGKGYLILAGTPSHKWLANRTKPVGKVTVSVSN